MKCPRCGKVRKGLLPGKYKCTNCGFRFEIKKKNFENFKYINSIFGLVASSLTIYCSYSMLNYEINEFHRPFFNLLIPLILIFSFLFIFYNLFLEKSSIGKSLIVGSLSGFIMGSLCWYFLFTTNYIFKSNISLEYHLLRVSQGKGGTLNFRIKTLNNKEFLLNIQTRDSKLLDRHEKLNIYRGIIGYYFGKIDMLDDSKIVP